MVADSDLRARGRPISPDKTASLGQGVWSFRWIIITGDRRLSPAFLQWLWKTTSGFSFARSRSASDILATAFVLSQLNNPIRRRLHEHHVRLLATFYQYLGLIGCDGPAICFCKSLSWACDISMNHSPTPSPHRPSHPSLQDDFQALQS